MPRTKGSKNGYSKDPNYKPVGKPAKKDYSYNGKLPSVRPHYNPAEHYSNQPKASNTPTIGSIRPTASPAEKYGNKPKAYSKVSVPSIRNKKMYYYDTIRDKDGNILGKYVDEKRTAEFGRKENERLYGHKRRTDYALQRTVEANLENREWNKGKGKVRKPWDMTDSELDEEARKRKKRRMMAPIKGLINKGKRKVKKLLDNF